MSADNGYIIRKRRNRGKFEYVLQMYFASDEAFPNVWNPRAEVFTSLLDAITAYNKQEDQGEYGLTINIEEVTR